ncbi:LysM peptidoglycan-binding domain-containing protein [Acinetobacter sp. MB5]|uniref:LysM peptidoglycan-binding domain-containing protein n=1 Tax=Acinetobacter sp. MB5 TaxID=2069438 RepID=UPI000DCFB298|nr:LysM domain-containing protein [Acinetobacter sp. MB5]
MPYKIKLKFISKNSQPVPNLYYEAGIGSTIFSKGYSNSKTGESRVFEAKGTVTHLKVAKEPNNIVQLLSLRPILHSELTMGKVNEIIIAVPVQIISLLLEKDRNGSYERNSKTTGTHTIKDGESLESIAKKYNLDVDDLAKKNGITDKNKIQTGKVIQIKNVKTASTKAINPQILYPSIVFHIVQKGDSLSSISRKYGVPVESLKTINSLNSEKVILNQKIYIKQADKSKDKERQLANFIVLMSIIDASRRSRGPTTTVTRPGTKQFYISFSGQLAAGLGVAGSAQIGTATDKRGNIGIFVTFNGKAVAAGTPGFAVDGGVTTTNAKDINELAGLGYTIDAQVHLLGGISGGAGYSKTNDIDTGEEKEVISTDVSAGFGIGANSGFGPGYTYVIPLN